MEKSDKDRRREYREKIIGHVLWSDAPGARDPDFEGLVMDISKGGLSILTHKPVARGDRLKLQGAGFWEGMKCATVVWCKEISPNIYQTGLNFSL